MQLNQHPTPNQELHQPDHRKNLPIPITVLKVDSDDSPKTFFGYAKNISRTGMMIGTTNPRELGSRFHLEIPLPAPLKLVATCECEVVWSRRWAKNAEIEPGMGLRFLDLSDEIATAIDEWIQHDREQHLLWH